tara:strand:- start:2060 stop:3127 length:1068 start_codon:yes stop_codon:yes gene_type:complete
MTWFDTISKKKEKGMRKLEEALLVEGYKIVETGAGKKHTKIKVKRLSEVDDPNAQEVQTTVSHTTAGGRFNPSMVVREIANKFAGRQRRGQGSFKLSNDKINTWQSILKIEPRDNPLSDEFEPPEIPPRRTPLISSLLAKNQHLATVYTILSKFKYAKMLFWVDDSSVEGLDMLRINNRFWIYDNSYIVLGFDSSKIGEVLQTSDIKLVTENIDLFLDAVLEFYLTVDSNYNERKNALETYATAIYESILIENQKRGKEKQYIDATVEEAVQILDSFEGKVKPIEIVIQRTIDDIKEGDTEVDWETLSELYDTDSGYFDTPLEGAEEAESEEGMSAVDYAESRTEEELRRRRNRG